MNGESSGPINLGNPDEFTIRELAERWHPINLNLQEARRNPMQDDPGQRRPAIDLARQQLIGSRPCRRDRVWLPPSTP